jgi:hypothetical protein
MPIIFSSTLVFADKAGAYQTESPTGLHSNVRLQAMPQILDQGESEWQWQTL